MRLRFVPLALAACSSLAPPADPDGGVRVTRLPPAPCAPGDRAFHRVRLPAQPRPAEAELTSGGLGVADFDGDGRLDLFLPHEAASALHLGAGDGRAFTDASDRLDGFDLEGAVGAAVADADGDGDVDLLVTRWQRSLVLLANDGAGRFVDVTARAGLGGTAARDVTAVWADVDGDLDLDLFVGSYGPKPDDAYTFDDPSLPPSTDPKRLYVADGAGGFRDRSDLLPAEVQAGYTFQATFLDTSGDGRPELFQWNDFGTAHPTLALANGGLDGFHHEPLATWLDRPFEDMGVGVADLDGDGLPDFATSSYRRLGLLLSSPADNAVGASWSDWAAALGLGVAPEQEYGWGVAFGDLDLDADEDLLVSFGDWTRYAAPRFERDGVWRNDGDAFVQIAPALGLDDDTVGRGLVVADLNGDGALDVVKRPLDAGATVDFGACPAASWVTVTLHQAAADTAALGARIRAIAGGRTQTRWIVAGGSSIFSSGPPVAHFGLADAEAVTLAIDWPDGRSDVVEVAARQHVHVHRGPRG